MPALTTNAAIALTIENSASGEDELLIGVPNTLVVTLTSDGSLSLPDSGSTLSIAFDTFLDPSSFDGVIAQASPAVDITVNGQAAPWSIDVTPHDYPWAIPAEFLITLTSIFPPASTAPGDTALTCSWTGLSGTGDGEQSESVTVAMTALPAPTLQFDCVPAVLYVSNGEAHPIDNSFTLSITNTSDAPLCPPGSPVQGQINISFPTVPDSSAPGAANAFCTDLQAGVVVATAGDQANWQLPPHPDANLTWTLSPATAEVLGPGETVSVTFTGLETSLPVGGAVLEISWSGLFGYSDGAASPQPFISKEVAPPTPQSITITPASPYYAQQPVTIAWKTFGSRMPKPVQLALREPYTVLYAGDAWDSFTITPLAPGNYMLTIFGSPNYVKDIFIDVAAATASFSVTPGPYQFGQAVEIAIDIDYATSYTLSGLTAPPLVDGSLQVPAYPIVLGTAPHVPPLTFTLAVTGYQAPAPITHTITLPDILAVGLLLATDGGIWRVQRDLVPLLIKSFDPASLPYVTDIAHIVSSTNPPIDDIFWACAQGPSAGAYCAQSGSVQGPPPGAISFWADPRGNYPYGIADTAGKVTVYAAPGISLWNGPVAMNVTAHSQSVYSVTCDAGYTSSPDGIYFLNNQGQPPPPSPVLIESGPAQGLAMGDVEQGQKYNPLFWFDPSQMSIMRLQITQPGQGGKPTQYLQLSQAPASQLSWHPAVGLIWVEDNGAGSNVVAYNGTGSPNVIHSSNKKIYCAMPDIVRTEP